MPSSGSPSPRFALPRIAWVAWGAYAAGAVALFLWRRTPVTPEAIGRWVGGVVGALLIPAGVAWAWWRWRGRSAKGTAAAFVVTLALLLAGQTAQLVERMRTTAALQELAVERKRVEAEQRQALAKGQPVDETKAADLARRTVDQWEKIARTGSSHERAAASASKAYVDNLLAAKQRYDEALAELRVDTLWDLEQYKTAADVVARRAAAQTFARANGELASLQDATGGGLRRTLEQHGLAREFVQLALASYRASTGKRLETIARVRQTDAEFATVVLAFLELVEANLGRWQADAASGKGVFTDRVAAESHAALIEQAQTIATKQQALQAEMAGTPAP